MHESVWSATASMPHFPSLKGSHKTDVLIIGGGLCGVLCAHFLAERGVDYILCEGAALGSGTTKNTTAKVTAQHGLMYADLLAREGKEAAQLYYNANMEAIGLYRKLSQSIRCDFEDKSAYTYSLKNREELLREAEAVCRIGGQADVVETPLLPFPTMGAVRFPAQGQFHPLKFLAGLSKGLRIYENTPIKSINGNTAFSPHGKIRAEKMIVTTHFPFLNMHGSYFLKLYQSRSYILALTDAQNVDGMYRDADDKGLSFRNWQNYLLLGGGSHRTGKKSDGWASLRTQVLESYPAAKEKYAFAAQDCISLDGRPYIGHYAKTTPSLYVATGFNKWGMTGSMVAARMLSAQLTGQKTPYDALFSPSRSIVKPQLFVNGAESAINLLTPTKKRCPHLGCALKWNPAEHSWDCPCHGSRFSETGALIDNPATDDLP